MVSFKGQTQRNKGAGFAQGQPPSTGERLPLTERDRKHAGSTGTPPGSPRARRRPRPVKTADATPRVLPHEPPLERQAERRPSSRTDPRPLAGIAESSPPAAAGQRIPGTPHLHLLSAQLSKNQAQGRHGRQREAGHDGSL